jgi:transcriptional regulator with XRE-family HTH domain
VANDICVRLGRRIHKLRTDRGWNQAYLAAISGIGRVHISELENGRREAGLRILEMLAGSFGIPLSELLSDL